MLEIGKCTVRRKADRGGGARRASSAARALHCCVLAEARYLAHAQPAGMMRALQQQGARVVLLDPAATLFDVADAHWLQDVDVVVARGRSTDLLARLSAAEAAGVPTLNPRRAIAAVLDKANMATQLQAAGIPVPATWIGSIEQLRRNVPAAAFPLVLKPVFGDNGRGIQLAETPARLAALAWNEATAIAQALLPNAGFDTKLYAIGQHVWAVRKASPLHGGGGAATLLSLRPGWRELALRCGAVFGLHLFGVDCIECDGALKVIEVNDFPNYSGVPGADLLLGRHIESATRQHEGTPQ